MMIKITERCTMGCPHCMNDAKPDGKDMSVDTLVKSLDFLRENNLGKEHLIITGGEPTEHEDFDAMIRTIIGYSAVHKCFAVITVTTNGEVIQKDPERFLSYSREADGFGFSLLFQVSADVRYYPRRIQTHKRIFREEGFVLVDDCIEQIYPQGRALDNNIPWESKSSKCFNVRSISHQLPESATLRDIEIQLVSRMKFCTPHIKINGDMGLGESDLCPSCASIYDDMETIMEKIRKFKCHKCDHINDKLPELYKRLL